MIPVRLQLHNFMSYGEDVPPLDLTGVKLACLSGDNGNGKTAILDAITWALFGKTRASSEDDVIRLGANECGVIFDFYLGSEKYRVQRQRGRKGGALWEFQVWQENGALRSLTGSNRNETQRVLSERLRMGYDTFLATCYFAQGRADEFTRSTPSKRKEILGQILSLDLYDRLEQMATDERKQAEDALMDAERSIKTIDVELEKRDYYEHQLEQAQARLTDVQARLSGHEAERADLLQTVQQQEGIEQKARDFEEKIRDAHEEITRVSRDLAMTERRIADAQAIASRRAEIEASCKHRDDLEKRLEPLKRQYDQILALEREANDLERTIRAAFEDIDRKHYQVRHEVENLEQAVRDLENLDVKLDGMDKDIASCGDPERDRQDAESARREIDDQLADLKGEHASCKNEEARLTKRIEALGGSDAAVCEYCGQDLPFERRHAAIEETQDGIQAIRARLTEVAGRGRDLKKQADDWQAKVNEAHKRFLSVVRLREERGQIAQHHSRLRDQVKELNARRQTLAKLHQQLERKDYAHEAQERRLQVSAQLEKSERVTAELQGVQNDLAGYRDLPAQVERLRQAQEVLDHEPVRADEFQALITKRQTQIGVAQERVAQFRAQTAGLDGLRRSLTTLDADLETARREAEQANREIGQHLAALERCKSLEAERKRYDAARLVASGKRDTYRELAGAFGKKGVQALIIENALPEIEQEANTLLDRMTGGAMKIQLLTTRERKSKGDGPIETLDIQISDDMGQRPYEMYSGGEAFRVNFALRVALSKMLAHRAGAPLQTLIIDEGFGTQDPRGREAILQAIDTIQSDFELILCITHIEELKEHFPTRIEVVKGTNGSMFSIN